jgi:hypothetical protein
MRKRSQITIAALIAACALAAVVGTANARRLALSENHILSHFREITFETGIGTQVICAMSMEGSFHSRTIEKVPGSLVGYISEARVKRPCRGGEAWPGTAQEGRPESLPWHAVFERFIGALPTITGIEFAAPNAVLLISIPGLAECLYRATSTEPMRGIIRREAGGRVTGVRVNERSTIPLAVRLSGLCPARSTFIAEGIVGTQVGYRELTVTLVA